jgi:hypothetical protein
MNKYQRGKIYKIVSDNYNKIYIGSTTKTLHSRLWYHNYTYNLWKNDYGCYLSSFKLISKGNFKIELLENYPCSLAKDLKKREQYWLDNFKDQCINWRRAEGYDKASSDKNYYAKNKFKILQYRKKWAKTKKNCDYCNKLISNRNWPKHRRTKKHLLNVNFFENILSESDHE